MTSFDGKPCKKCGTSEWYDCGSCKECTKIKSSKRAIANKNKFKDKDEVCEKCGTNKWHKNTGLCILCTNTANNARSRDRYKARNGEPYPDKLCEKCGTYKRDVEGRCKYCRKKTGTERRLRNKDKNLAKDKVCDTCGTNDWNGEGKCRECRSNYSKKRRKDNPEHVAAIAKKSRLKYKDAYNEKSRIYDKKNAKRIKLRKAQYYIDNKEHITARVSEYNKKNPSVSKISSAKRRARIAENGGTCTTKEWKDMCEKYDYYCLMCREKFDISTLTIDHVIPISKGGTSNIENLQPLCLPCNSKKHTDDTDYRLEYDTII